MDKKSIIALILITGVIIVWMVFQSINRQSLPPEEKFRSLTMKDSLDKLEASKKIDTLQKLNDSANTLINQDSIKNSVAFQKYGFFSEFANGQNDKITIKNKLTKVILQTKGASVKSLYLNDYLRWDQNQVNLINSHKGDLYLSFRTQQNHLIDTRDLTFQVNSNQNNYELKDKDTLNLVYTMQLDDDSKIQVKYTFYGNSYAFNYDVDVVNMEEFIPNRGYRIVWGSGIRNQEKNSVDEATAMLAYASLNGDLEQLDADDENGKHISSTGLIDYAAVKTKYFAIALIPQPFKSFDGTVDLDGVKKNFKNNGISKDYSMEFRFPYSGGIAKHKYQIFAGPLDYSVAKHFKVEALVDLGFRYGIRQIGEYFMLPIFEFIHTYIPNYGVSLILFAILMKLLLYPLSISQMRSSQKMQLIAPIVNKMREKYPDDTQKQQLETQKIYSEYGINPAGGCLPLLLQMPILFALYAVLRNAIELRQADFFLWITDLSIPDAIVHFGFSIMGMNQLSGLALLMGATLFIQQKQTITDPRQKSMVYIMPVMMTILFNYLPSGLNLYYFTFNIVTIGMQVYINKFSSKKYTLEDLKKAPKKKEGWMQKKMREAQELQAKQGKSIPQLKNITKEVQNKNKSKK
jgi:YidC/Oxa1 family membrane protein insertase